MGRRSSRALAIVFLLTACGETQRSGPVMPAETQSREVINLRAFARLYGVMRWFHPSDESADLDWNAYAVLGVRTVRGAADRRSLRFALRALVEPIGPSVQIIEEGAPIPAMPRFPVGGDPVAWQHTGPGFDGGQRGTYESKRTHRTGWVQAAGTWGAFSQSLDAARLRGKHIRLRAQLRAGAGTRVGAWLRVDRPSKQTGFFDNMMDRAVTGSTWTLGTIEGLVATDAERVVIGGIAMGDEGWFDDFVVEVNGGDGAWSPVAVTNADFERSATGWSTTQSYELVATARARDGGAALQFRAPRVELTADLYDERPAYGEVSIVDLGDGLRAVVPLALASVGDHTQPRGDRAALDVALSKVPAATTDDAGAIADVVVAWNVFAHFYPYLDVISTDWHAYLDEALAGALAAGPNTNARTAVLERLVVAAQDGHGSVILGRQRAQLVLALELVEGKVVVAASGDPAVERGDEVISIDGVAAADALAAERRRHSGSPQWQTYLALRAMGGDDPDGTAALELSRGGRPFTAQVKRGERPEVFSYPPIGEVEPGIWLIDLSRAEVEAIEAKKTALAGARGIVFDLRGYPNGTHGVLAHLIDTPEHDLWMHIPHIVRPNLAGQPHKAVKWTTAGWDLEPAAPHWKAKVAFITGPGAISYAESVMGYVEALGLPIVGATTAGTNGNIRQVALPSGARVVFTGMKVTRHDGTRSHLQGIRPTVPVERTLAGVAAGRDEELERALEIVKRP